MAHNARPVVGDEDRQRVTGRGARALRPAPRVVGSDDSVRRFCRGVGGDVMAKRYSG